jgi:hypothetical protein
MQERLCSHLTLSHRTQNLRVTSCLRTIHLISLQDGRTSGRRHETVRGVPSRQGAHARAPSRVTNLNDQRPPTWAPKRKRGMASLPVLHKSRRPSCTRRPTSILSTSQPRDRTLHAYIVYRSAYMGQCKPAPTIGGRSLVLTHELSSVILTSKLRVTSYLRCTIQLSLHDCTVGWTLPCLHLHPDTVFLL